MSLITETNEQYYQGVQGFRSDAGNTANQKFTTTFNTNLRLGSATSWNPNDINYAQNNFKVYTSATGIPGSWSEWITELKASNNIIELVAQPGVNAYVVVQLKILTGGKYGNTPADQAFGEAVEDNYGGYEYIKLNDAIDNFMVGYVEKVSLHKHINYY